MRCTGSSQVADLRAQAGQAEGEEQREAGGEDGGVAAAAARGRLSPATGRTVSKKPVLNSTRLRAGGSARSGGSRARSPCSRWRPSSPRLPPAPRPRPVPPGIALGPARGRHFRRFLPWPRPGWAWWPSPGRSPLAGRAAAAVAAAVTLGLLFDLALLGLEPVGATRTLMDRALSRGHVVPHRRRAASPGSGRVVDHHALRPDCGGTATHPPGPVLFYRGLIGFFRPRRRHRRRPLPAGSIPGRTPPAPVRAAALAGRESILLLGALPRAPLFGARRRRARRGRRPPRGRALAAGARGRPHGPAVRPAAGAAGDGGRRVSRPAAVSASSDRRHAVLAAAGRCLRRDRRLRLLRRGCAGRDRGGRGRDRDREGRGAWRRRDRRRRGGDRPRAADGMGHEPIAAARTALAIHRETYTLPRSYATWLAFNPARPRAVPWRARGRAARGAPRARGRHAGPSAASAPCSPRVSPVSSCPGPCAARSAGSPSRSMPALLLAAMAPRGTRPTRPDARRGRARRPAPPRSHRRHRRPLGGGLADAGHDRARLLPERRSPRSSTRWRGSASSRCTAASASTRSR